MQVASRDEMRERFDGMPGFAEAGRLFALLVAGVAVIALVGVQPADAGLQEREHVSTLQLQVWGLPRIRVQADPGKMISLQRCEDESPTPQDPCAEGAFVIPESLFVYKGTLVPDFSAMCCENVASPGEKIPFFEGSQQTNLDTRVLKSVEVSVRNRAGTLVPGGYNPYLGRTEFGGSLPLTGYLRIKFRPYIARSQGELVTRTPEDMTVPASVFGRQWGHADVNNGLPPDNQDGVRLWFLGQPWRAGHATTFLGSVTVSQLPTKTPLGEASYVREDYYQNPINGHLKWNLFEGRIGSTLLFDTDLDGYGHVKIVTPLAIHHEELRRQLDKKRFYTVHSWAEIEIEIMPAEVSMSFRPDPRGGLSLAGAAGLALLGLYRARQRSR